MRIHLLLFYFIAAQVCAQAPQFSQFYTNPLYQNPALAGDAGTPRLIVNYRNQWPSVGTAFQTAAFFISNRVQHIAGLFGPFNETFCFVHIVVKNSILTQFIVIMTSISVVNTSTSSS